MRRPGFTLLELLFLLAVLGVLLALAVPSFAHALDVFSVRAGRDVIITAVTRTRSLALARGGAILRVDENGVITVHTRDTASVHTQWDLRARYGLSIDIENSARTSALLEYDALGIGRLANLTVRLRRGRAAGAVSFSAYGRPRAW